jgi:hypothetical protein
MKQNYICLTSFSLDPPVTGFIKIYEIVLEVDFWLIA